MKRKPHKLAVLVAGAAAALVLVALACVGPVIILPPPNPPEGVDTALVGYASYCGCLPVQDGADAMVVFVNHSRRTGFFRAPSAGVTFANACGAYEGGELPAEAGDQIEMYYRSADGGYSQSVVFTADLGGAAPAACEPCAGCP